MRFVLASASPTRLRVLRQAGFDPEVIVSGVDEDADGDAPTRVTAHARRKATAVAKSHPDAVVLGCDSLVVLGDRILGKPASPAEAAEWWRAMQTRTVTVWTGHHVVHGSRSFTCPVSATVTFGAVVDEEIDRYVATGEPLGAAGAFRLDGRAAAFVESIEGDPGTVHGVSVSALNTALSELGIEVTDLWV